MQVRAPAASELVSIGALARVAGVAPETIRSWERRYDFPIPHRLPSGHRRYDGQTVERIRLVRRALEAGFRPSEAVPATEDWLRRSLALHATPRAIDLSEWLDLTQAYDADGLERCFARSLHAAGAQSFVRDYAAPFLRALGERWKAGAVTVAQEHFVSDLLATFLASRWRPLSERSDGPGVLCLTLPGEDHVIGLHLGALILAGMGFRVVFVGRACPLEEAAEAARGRALATLVAVSAAAKKTSTRRQLRELAGKLGEVELLIGSPWKPAERSGVTWLRDFDDLASWAAQVRPLPGGDR